MKYSQRVRHRIEWRTVTTRCLEVLTPDGVWEVLNPAPPSEERDEMVNCRVRVNDKRERIATATIEVLTDQGWVALLTPGRDRDDLPIDVATIQRAIDHAIDEVAPLDLVLG